MGAIALDGLGVDNDVTLHFDCSIRQNQCEPRAEYQAGWGLEDMVDGGP